MFRLDPRIGDDTVPVTVLALCRVLLIRDARFPWVVLVPERPNAIEISDLSPADRHRLVDEIAATSNAMQTLFRPDKLNVGQLGNAVPQLHVHVVARYRSDPAWPGPVWSSGPAVAYGDFELQDRARRLRQELKV
jgi:diadenosine tetraphosphate (Ap4A) HIT family hydrolase